MLDLSLKEQKQINGGRLYFVVYASYDSDAIHNFLESHLANTVSEAKWWENHYKKEDGYPVVKIATYRD